MAVLNFRSTPGTLWIAAGQAAANAGWGRVQSRGRCWGEGCCWSPAHPRPTAPSQSSRVGTGAVTAVVTGALHGQGMHHIRAGLKDRQPSPSGWQEKAVGPVALKMFSSYTFNASLHFPSLFTYCNWVVSDIILHHWNCSEILKKLWIFGLFILNT